MPGMRIMGYAILFPHTPGILTLIFRSDCRCRLADMEHAAGAAFGQRGCGFVERSPPLCGLPDGFRATGLAGEAWRDIDPDHRKHRVDEDRRRNADTAKQGIGLIAHAPYIAEP